MTYQPPFDESGFIEGNDMTELHSPEALRDVMRNDQATAEVDATAGKIAAFYERLAATGMDRDAVNDRTATYAEMLLMQHFGCDVSQVYGIGIVGEG